MNADAHHPAAPDLSRRDLTVDLARVFCVLLVVVIHVLMIGVSRDATGALSVDRTLGEQPWFPLATWAGQVMPLFFVVGGFASATAWASTVRRGGDAGDYVRGRLLRLGRPAAAILVFLAAGLATARLLGVDPALLATVAVGIGSPLWFLAAYGITQLFVPAMAGLHARRPVVTLVALAAGGVAVDLVRHATGVTDVGLLNLLFVWLFVQQLGFVYAGARFDRIPRRMLVAVAAACYLLLVPMTSSGVWSRDMLVDLNPPMATLMVLGVAQLCLLRLARPVLARLMDTRAARAVVFAVGSRGMTVYLWHLPLAIVLTGVLLAIGAPFPEPASAIWWWSRIPVVAGVLGLAFAVSLAVGRLERAPRADGPGQGRPSLPVIGVAAVLLIAPAFAIMLDGLSLPLAVIGAVAVPASIRLLGPVSSPRAPSLGTPTGSRRGTTSASPAR